MNRRAFVTGIAAAGSLLPKRNIAALDIDIVESPVLRMLRSIPDRSGTEGFDFTITHATNHALQRKVTPENPLMYWDPIGEDYQTIFGFHNSRRALSGSQDGVSLWQMDTDHYQRDQTRQTLESNGWELVNEDLNLMQYAGSEEDRSVLAASLNELNNFITDGVWDWVAFPEEETIVVGANDILIHNIADHIMNQTSMRAVSANFHYIRYILRADTYGMSLLPRQALPVESTQASFISRSWTGDVPIIQSIGLNLESSDRIEPILETVQARLESETSSMTGLPYADFLAIEETTDYQNALRIDFIDSTGEWDIRQALHLGDLQMLPLI